MRIQVEKFPDLVYRGRRLIWDSRQLADERPEWVIVPSDHGFAPQVRADLLRRAGARFVVAKSDEGADLAGRDVERVDWPRVFLGEAAAEAAQFPSRHLRILGVTGTNGKTTSAGLLRAILVEAGYRVAEIGTLGVTVWEDRIATPLVQLETGFTTPDAPLLQSLLAQLVAGGVTHVVMEVSSHSLELARVAGTEFCGALFTNLTQDHLDLHGTMEKYEAAKARLFTEVLSWSAARGRRVAAVLLDDEGGAGRRIMGAIPGSVPALLLRPGVDFEVLSTTVAGTRLRLNAGEARGPVDRRAEHIFESPMVGAFNAENLAGAVELARVAMEVGDMSIGAALRKFPGPRGRLERVPDPSGRGRSVFVDYAHTPDAVEKTLGVLRKLVEPDRKLIVVIGCGGDRDRTKRPRMAQAAVGGADWALLTSDNPRSEDPRVILNEMAAGLLGVDLTRWAIECDRDRAIGMAIRSMRGGDLCVVAGKGHEDYQIIAGVKHPFSDVEVCSKYLASL